MIKGVKIWDLLWFVVPVLMVLLSSVISTDQVCSAVKINLKDFAENQFLKAEEINEDLELQLSREIEGSKLIHNDLSTVENHLKNNKFVKDAEVLSDHKGQIILNITQERPMARIVTDGKTYYLTESGAIMPVSKNYSSRVMVILGEKVNEILLTDSLNQKRKEEFISFIRYIHEDKFLKAQVASLDVTSEEKVIIYPQVTKQPIELGTCENYVDKLLKLKIFYDQILPRKGWNSYSKVNLEFKNQIICE